MLRVKDITLMAILTAILFVQEQLLLFLPNIQLTVLLIVVYSRCLGFKKTSIIVVIHVILDNLFMGSLNFIYTPFMLIGWLFIPLVQCTIFKKVNSPIKLAFLGIIYSFVYSWCFIIPGMIIQEIGFLEYLTMDIVFEIVLAIGSFLTILWLYEPLSKVLNQMESNN
jgi:hypothetical protein